MAYETTMGLASNQGDKNGRQKGLEEKEEEERRSGNWRKTNQIDRGRTIQKYGMATSVEGD